MKIIRAHTDGRGEGMKSGTEYTRERRKALKAMGRCMVCGKEKAAAGKNMCEKCRKKENEYRRNRRRAFKKQGLCGYCGQERENEKYKLCERCREKGRQAYKARTERN